jgi:hypothetical protein
MFRRIMFSAVLVMMAGVCLAQVAAGTKVPSMQVETVFADKYDLKAKLTGKTGILVFHNKESAEAARKWLALVAYKWRDHTDKLVFLGIVDNSETPGFMRSFAASQVRREADRTNDLLKYYYRTEKKTPPKNVEKVIAFIPDYSRDIFKAFSVGDVTDSPVFVITSRSAKVAAVYTENNDETYENIKKIVESLMGIAGRSSPPATAPAPATSTGR